MHSTIARQRLIWDASAAGGAGRASRGTPGPRAPLLTALRVRVAMRSETRGCGAWGGNSLCGEADGFPDVRVALDQDAARESTRRTVPDRRGHGRGDGAPSG